MTRGQSVAIGMVFAVAGLGVAVHTSNNMTFSSRFAAASYNGSRTKYEDCKEGAARYLCDYVRDLRTTKRPVYEAGEIATDYRRYIP